MKTYSISLRLQRTTTDYAYVSVPITDDIITEEADGTRRIDAEKMMQYGIELGRSPSVNWHLEEQSIQPHPIQKAPEPDER